MTRCEHAAAAEFLAGVSLARCKDAATTHFSGRRFCGLLYRGIYHKILGKDFLDSREEAAVDNILAVIILWHVDAKDLPHISRKAFL